MFPETESDCVCTHPKQPHGFFSWTKEVVSNYMQWWFDFLDKDRSKWSTEVSLVCLQWNLLLTRLCIYVSRPATRSMRNKSICIRLSSFIFEHLHLVEIVSRHDILVYINRFRGVLFCISSRKYFQRKLVAVLQATI